MRIMLNQQTSPLRTITRLSLFFRLVLISALGITELYPKFGRFAVRARTFCPNSSFE